LTDRALAWQQRAEKVLRTAEVSEELKKLNDTEANGRKEKKTKGKILFDIQKLSNINLTNNLKID
jgi:hypothetical protein